MVIRRLGAAGDAARGVDVARWGDGVGDFGIIVHAHAHREVLSVRMGAPRRGSGRERRDPPLPAAFFSLTLGDGETERERRARSPP